MLAPCRQGSDCCSGQCNGQGFCSSGYSVDCQTDADCPARTTCLLCLGLCVYPADGYCDEKASCPCDYHCANAICTANDPDAGANGCVAHADCPVNESCNPADLQCGYPMCWNPAGPALPDGGATTPAPCAPDGGESCAPGLSCMPYDGSFFCLRPCNTNPNCGKGQFCSSFGGGVQVCAYDCSLYCATSADCPQPGLFCDGEHQCRATGC